MSECAGCAEIREVQAEVSGVKTSQAVLANEVGHLRKAVEDLAAAVKELTQQERTRLPQALPQPLAAPDRGRDWFSIARDLSRNVGFWMFLSVLALVLRTDGVLALIKMLAGK